MIVCSECGKIFRRIHWNNHGCKSIVWRCISRLEPTGLECHARTVNELDLQKAVIAALNELLGDREGYQNQLQQNIAAVIRASATETADGIDERLLELQQELLKRANSKMRFSGSGNCNSRPQWTPPQGMNNSDASPNFRILSAAS